MRWITLAAALALAALYTALAPTPARAMPTAELRAVHPAQTGDLSRNTIVRLRVGYESADPITIHATLVDASGRAIGINGGMALRPAGRGEAALWVGALGALRAEAIDLVLGRPGAAAPILRFRVPYAVSFTGEAGGGPMPAPAWYAALEAEQQRAWADHHAANPAPEAGPLADAALLATPLYPFVQIAALIFLRGRWRLAAALPLVVTGPLLAVLLLVPLAGGNIGLLPIVLVFAAPPSVLYLVGLLAVRLLVRARSG